jgi:hypothetical protein
MGDDPGRAELPGQATLRCQYADAHGTTFVTVNDAAPKVAWFKSLQCLGSGGSSYGLT